MDFEKKFFELLDSSKAKQIIRDVIRENNNGTTQAFNGFNPFGNFQKNIDAKKIADLQEKLRILEREKNNYLDAYQKASNALRNKEFELNNIQAQIGRLQKDKERIEAELTDERISYERTSSELTDLKSEFTEVKKELITVKNDYERLQKSFDKPIFCYEQYLKLSDSTKMGLSNVISSISVSLFIATCTNADNLKKIWEYTKEILSDNSKQGDVFILIEVFDYFFNLYNQSLVEPIYARDTTEIGDDYDDEYHARSRESATSGRISKVLLRGYSSINTGRIICKSVVQV